MEQKARKEVQSQAEEEQTGRCCFASMVVAIEFVEVVEVVVEVEVGVDVVVVVVVVVVVLVVGGRLEVDVVVKQ